MIFCFRLQGRFPNVDICSSRLDGIFQTRWTGQRYVSLWSIRQKRLIYPFWSDVIDVDRITLQKRRKDILIRRSEVRAFDQLINHFRFDARGYVTRYQPIESIDRGKSRREMWIGPSRNLLIIEKVRISGRRFSYPPRRWKARDTFFHGLVRGDSRAIHFAKTWLRGTRKRSRSGFILHLWQRARMLFLSKLSPIWNIRSLALCTDTFLVFFLFIPMRRPRWRIAFFDTAYRSVLDVDCGDLLRNAETRMLIRQAVGRMIYVCLMGTTAVVIFSVIAPATCAIWLTCWESGNDTVNRKDAIVKRGNW